MVSLREAIDKKICRVCLGPDKPRTFNGKLDPFVYNYGSEYAHESCLKTMPLLPDITRLLIGSHKAAIKQEILEALSRCQERAVRDGDFDYAAQHRELAISVQNDNFSIILKQELQFTAGDGI